MAASLKKNIKMNKKEKYLTICPKCKSLDVSSDNSDTLAGFGIPANYKCNKCNYVAKIFPQITEKQVLKQKNDTKK